MFSKILILEPKLSGLKFEPILLLLYYLLVLTSFQQFSSLCGCSNQDNPLDSEMRNFLQVD